MVSSEHEWRKALREQREPECPGWPLNNVREISQSKSKPLAVIDQNIR